jgi:hypothetical protein
VAILTIINGNHHFPLKWYPSIFRHVLRHFLGFEVMKHREMQKFTSGLEIKDAEAKWGVSVC